VLPTFREGLPQTALEAAASGLPMVSTLVSGVVDIVEDGVTGILVSARDARALGAAIRALALDPQRRFTMGQAARFRVCERFSEQRMNALWLAEYRRFAEKYLAGTATVTNTGAIQARGSDAY
jgi:glycosyltransferase involved in cell wall biosynthesis